MSGIKAEMKAIRELLAQKRGRDAMLAAQGLLDGGDGASAQKFEAELYIFAGKGAYLEGEYVKAKELYNRAIALKPDNAAGYLGLGECFESTLNVSEDSASNLVANFLTVREKIPSDRQNELAQRHMEKLFFNNYLQQAVEMISYISGWESNQRCLEIAETAYRLASQHVSKRSDTEVDGDAKLQHLESLIEKMKTPFQTAAELYLSIVRTKWLRASSEQSHLWEQKFREELDSCRQQVKYNISAELVKSQLAEHVGSPRAVNTVAKYGFCLIPELECTLSGDIFRLTKRSIFLDPREVALQVRCLAVIGEAQSILSSGGQVQKMNVEPFQKITSCGESPAAQLLVAAVYLLQSQFIQADSALSIAEKTAEPELEPLLCMLTARSKQSNPRSNIEDAIPYYRRIASSNGPKEQRNFANRQICAIWHALRKENLIDDYLESISKDNVADRDTVWFRCELAHLAARRGEFDSAMEEASLSVQFADKNHETSHMRSWAWYTKGLVQWNMGGAEKSSRKGCYSSLLTAVKINSSCGDAFAMLGRYYIEVANDIGRAQKCLQRALVINPFNSSAGNLLAEIQAFRLRDTPHSTENLCREVLSTAPECIWARLLLIATQLQSDASDLDESKLSLQRLLRRNPREWRMWELLAGIYFKQQRRTAALKASEKALELHSITTGNGVNIYSSTLIATLLISLGRFANAITFLSNYVSQHATLLSNIPAWPLKLSEAHLFRAQKLWIPFFAPFAAEADIASARSLLSQLDPSEMIYEPMIRVSVDRMSALCYLNAAQNSAVGRKNSENVARASRLLCRIVHMCPHQGLVWRELAIGTGNVRAALSALSLSPTNEKSWIALGNCFAKKSESENGANAESAAASAERAYIRAVMLSKGDSQGWERLGRLYYVKKKFSMAADAFEKARVLNPSSASAWEGVALCMYEMKRVDVPIGNVYAAIDPYLRQAVRLGCCPASSLLLAAGAIDRLRRGGTSDIDSEALTEIFKYLSFFESSDTIENKTAHTEYGHLYASWLAEHHLLPRMAPELALPSLVTKKTAPKPLNTIPPFRLRSTFSVVSSTVSANSINSSTTHLSDSLLAISTPKVKCAALVLFGIGHLKQNDRIQGFRYLTRAVHLYPDSGLPISALNSAALDDGSCEAQLLAFLSNVRDSVGC